MHVGEKTKKEAKFLLWNHLTLMITNHVPSFLPLPLTSDVVLYSKMFGNFLSLSMLTIHLFFVLFLINNTQNEAEFCYELCSTYYDTDITWTRTLQHV